jgi:signal transduction histidine kinase
LEAVLSDQSVTGSQFRRRSWIAVFAGFLLLVVAVLCACITAISEDQTSRAGRRSRDIRDVEAALFACVADAETGQRGYLLSGDSSYLQPFVRARSRLPRLEQRLSGLTQDDRDQAPKTHELIALIDRKMDELSKSVALGQSGDVAGAIRNLRTNRGRDLMAEIRSESAALDSAEGRVVDARRTQLALQRKLLLLTIVLALITAIALSVFVAVEVRRYARALAAQNEALKREAAQRMQAEAQFRQAQKMEALGQLTGGIAHDFNNMLAIVVGNLDMMIRRLPGHDERIRAMAENALNGANKAATLTKRLLAFSRLQPLDPRPIDVNKCVSDISELLRRTLGERIAIETVLGGGTWRALIDGAQLESAILNLAVNARDAMASDGRLTIETANASLDSAYAEANEGVEPGHYVMLAVTDTGSGMTSEVMEKAFDPFFTTKPLGEGTGLGLSQVHGFLRQSGGHIKLYSEVGIGTTVKLYLPRDESGAASIDTPSPARASFDNLEAKILVVEDDPGVRSFVVSAVRELGFDVVEADSAAVALEQLEQDLSISLLLTDVVMPGATGRELADELASLRPHLPVVYMTGYTRNAIVHNGALDRGTRLLTKPFTLAELDRELNAALRGPVK